MVEKTLPDSLVPPTDPTLMWTDTILRLAHSSRLAAKITLYELNTTASPDGAALATCVGAAFRLLDTVKPWEQGFILKDVFAMMTWSPAIRTFARQVVLLRSQGRHEEAQRPLAALERIEAALRSYLSTIAATSAQRILSQHKPFFDCDESTCMPSCTDDDVAALMKSGPKTERVW